MFSFASSVTLSTATPSATYCARRASAVSIPFLGRSTGDRLPLGHSVRAGRVDPHRDRNGARGDRHRTRHDRNRAGHAGGSAYLRWSRTWYFFDETGDLVTLHENAIPLDETPIFGGNNILYVLEINAGLAAELGIGEDTQLRHPAVDPELAVWACPQ